MNQQHQSRASQKPDRPGATRIGYFGYFGRNLPALRLRKVHHYNHRRPNHTLRHRQARKKLCTYGYKQANTTSPIFALPVQYVVPLFQRAYVWNRQYHWEPLWDDIRDGQLFREVETPPERDNSVEGQFFYRRNTLGVGVVVPIMMQLYGRLETGSERDRCLIAIESWLVRRLLAGYSAEGTTSSS
jgi:hypothetical protein